MELVLDFVSANAYLALGPAKQLADELGVELKLTPLRTAVDLVPSTNESSQESVGERHRRVRAEYSRRDAMRYAAIQGLSINFNDKNADSTIALQGLLAANASNAGFKYADMVFQRFWLGEIQLDAKEAVASILKDVGVSSFKAEDPRWDLVPIEEELEVREIFAVPTFWVEGERYLGRQHLPMIRWQLAQYEGPGPL